METTIQKRFAGNALNVVIPTGMTLTDGTTTYTVGTTAFTAVGYYTFYRQTDDKWAMRFMT